MQKLSVARAIMFPIGVFILAAGLTQPAWAIVGPDLPAPPVAILGGVAIVGVLIIAKVFRRK